MDSLRTAFIDDEETWEKFLLSHPESNFLQSWYWGKFHQSLQKEVRYLGLLENEALVGASCVVLEKAKRGTYLTIAGGPILDWNKDAHIQAMVQAIKTLGKELSCSFVRFRPQIKNSPEILEKFSSMGFKLSPMHVTADLTIILDIQKSEDELLSHMRKTTRYEIRRAIKEGIHVESSTYLEDIQEFYSHQVGLAKKHQFVPFSKRFLLNQFETFSKEGKAKLFHAKKGTTLLASAFVIFYNKEAVYHYGISTPENARLPGAYACQWAAMLEAKRLGMERYNFWGVAPESQKNHRFSGVSVFKRGFGGEEFEYVPAHDIPLRWDYILTRTFEQARKMSRHL